MTRLLATTIFLALIAGACAGGGDEGDAAAVLTEYLEVWNSEDAEAVMVFYAEDAVVENHPTVDRVTATGTAEILTLETSMDGFQGSSGVMEYVNMEGSGDTVTFDSIFHNWRGECFSSGGHELSVADGKITLWLFGDEGTTLCEQP